MYVAKEVAKENVMATITSTTITLLSRYIVCVPENQRCAIRRTGAVHRSRHGNFWIFGRYCRVLRRFRSPLGGGNGQWTSFVGNKQQCDVLGCKPPPDRRCDIRPSSGGVWGGELYWLLWKIRVITAVCRTNSRCGEDSKNLTKVDQLRTK